MLFWTTCSDRFWRDDSSWKGKGFDDLAERLKSGSTVESPVVMKFAELPQIKTTGSLRNDVLWSSLWWSAANVLRNVCEADTGVGELCEKQIGWGRLIFGALCFLTSEYCHDSLPSRTPLLKMLATNSERSGLTEGNRYISLNLQNRDDSTVCPRAKHPLELDLTPLKGLVGRLAEDLQPTWYLQSTGDKADF